MIKIQLTQGKAALIDDDDYSIITMYKWCAKHEKISFYAVSRINGKVIKLHRFIMKPNPDEECDHINGDGLDNRKSNLRIVTHSQNLMNQRKQSGRSSQFKGVDWYKSRNKWRTKITLNQKTIFIGYFLNEEEAAKAYDTAAKKYFGEYAKLNFNEDSGGN